MSFLAYLVGFVLGLLVGWRTFRGASLDYVRYKIMMERAYLRVLRMIEEGKVASGAEREFIHIALMTVDESVKDMQRIDQKELRHIRWLKKLACKGYIGFEELIDSWEK